MGLFAPRTQPEITAGMISTLISSTPLSDVSFGSVLVTMLEAAAQEDDEQYFQMLQVINNYSIDKTVGQDLENRAAEFNIEKRGAVQASTTVTISDSAITKISTGVFGGLSGSPAGSTAINGDSLTGFPNSGSIVVGRGTANVETVAYSSITDNGNFVVFNLSTALANDHGTDETIILSAGGDRVIAAGTVVVVPASDTTENVTFTLDDSATILDGESEVTGVPVTASEAGSDANVPVGAIQQFDSKPFATAIVRNPARVTNGLDIETEQELRDRIKDTIQSLSRGTGRAILTGVLGLVSAAENKRVVSASLRPTTLPAQVVKLFIDDGTGFIPSFSHVGVETVIDLATGGERFLGIANTPAMKAFVETENSAPFNVLDNTSLFVEVNGQAETITFTSSDFLSPGAATVQEVLTKINRTAQTFEARASTAGTKLRIFARADTGEEIRVTGGAANTALQFPTDTKFTTKLFRRRNDRIKLLSKDGRTASIESGATATYDFSAIKSQLCVIIDGKTDNIQHIWFSPGDFVSPNAANLLEVRDLFNARGSGFFATESSNDTKITLVSNIERSAGSKIRVLSDFTSIFNEESGANVDRTADLKDSGSSTTLFSADADYLYLGHSDIPFDSVYIRLSTPASADILPNFEFFKGAGVNAWTQFGVHDETEGFTQDGHILFQPPFEWIKTTVESVDAYWIRIQRTNPASLTAPLATRVRICGANEQFQFSETEVEGADNDYTLNRFVGQIELEETLQAGDQVTLGTTESRPFLISVNGSYNGLVGTTLTLEVDGITQTATFVAGDFGDVLAALPTEVAQVINDDVSGVTAEAIDSNTRVQITLNKYNDGRLRILDIGANSILNFPTDELTSFVSHIPALESDQGPFSFSAGDTVVVVIDDNFANSFNVPVFKEGTLTTVGSTSSITDSTLSATFPTTGDVNSFDVAIIDGPQAGQRVEILSYNALTGEMTLATPLAGLPDVGDTYQIIAKTTSQVVSLWNNTQITLLSTRATILDSDSGTRVQIASQVSGEEASVQVTGGTANSQFNFPVSRRGVDGYKYFTGLAQLSQKTVDGDQNDSENFPGIRAAGVQVEIIEPVTVPVSVELQVTTNEGVSLVSVTSNIKSAVSNYINRLDVGADVIVSDIIVAVKGVDGVADAVILQPTANIPIADNEKSSIVEDDITVG